MPLALLFTTPLGVRRILQGKLLATLIVVLLLYAAAMPFLMVMHLLRGIDVPTILAILACSLVLVTIGAAFALSVSAQARGTSSQHLAFFINMLFLMIGLQATWLLGRGFIDAGVSSPGPWIALAVFCGIAGGITCATYATARSQLDPIRRRVRGRAHPIRSDTRAANGPASDGDRATAAGDERRAPRQAPEETGARCA